MLFNRRVLGQNRTGLFRPKTFDFCEYFGRFYIESATISSAARTEPNSFWVRDKIDSEIDELILNVCTFGAQPKLRFVCAMSGILLYIRYVVYYSVVSTVEVSMYIRRFEESVRGIVCTRGTTK